MEIVREMFELSLNAAAERCWDADVEYHEDPRWPGASSYRGREAVLQCWRGYMEALGAEDSVNVGIERILDASERGVVAFVRYSGQAPSGLPYEHRWGYLVRVEDERVVSVRSYYEPAEAFEALGLSEQDAHADS